MLIAPNVELPDSALSAHVAIVGATGSGKTYTVKGIVEKHLDARRRVVILDPTGAWWGLRLRADGVTPAHPITIFGGDHADVPITEHAGEPLGKLLAERPMSAILDMSNMGVGERHRFAQRFAEAVYQHNRTPLQLIVDEADEFAPQSGPPGTERMLGAFDRIVRRGRLKGFRVTLITQRPAVINKNVFTQAHTLIAMRLPAPQDRKAVEDWIKGQADVDDGKRVMASLAKLQRGHGWIWAPAHGVLEQVSFPAITTFDSSRTPEDGEELQEPTTLGSIDLGEIQKVMGAAIEEAANNDVEVLKKRLKQLEQDLAQARRLPVQVTQPEDLDKQIHRAQLDVLSRVCKRCEAPWATIDAAVKSLRELADTIERADGAVRLGVSQCPTDHDAPGPQAGSSPAGEPYAEPPVRAENGSNFGNGAVGSVRARDRGAITTLGPAATNGVARGGGTSTAAPSSAGTAGQRILNSLAWWSAARKPEVTRVQAAFMAGYSPRSSGFEKQLSELRGAGLIEFPQAGKVALTASGRSRAHRPKRSPASSDLWTCVLDQLGHGSAAARVMIALNESDAEAMSRADLAAASQYSDRSSGFEKTLSTLRGLELVTFPAAGAVSLADWLFLGDAA